VARRPHAGAALKEAVALHQQGRLLEAERIYAAILAEKPGRSDVLNLLGLLRHQQGRNIEALQLIAAALNAAPRSADIRNNLGLVLGALGQHQEALACFDEVLAHQRQHLNALFNRATTLVRLKRYEDALAAYERLLARKPDHLAALNECGGLNARLGRPEAALACYERALAVAPSLPELHINKGTALRAMNCDEEALASFAAAVAIDPQRAEAHWNASLVRLRRGEFAAGWRDYEWRWRKADWADKRRDFSAPRWLGEEPLAGRTILLHAEQGFGDTLQFVRYVPLVAERGATVVLEVQPELKGLLQRQGEGIHIVGRGEPLPAFDYHCPLLSLPLAFGTRLETIPNAVPYIAVPECGGNGLPGQLAGGDRPRVGIVWSGSAAHLNDRHRSIPLAVMAPLLSLSGITFVSLQKNAAPHDLAQLAALANVIHIGDDFRDFADAARAIAMLDLVISVDTAIAHLAGAMAKPVWVLLPFSPDFRWLLAREDSPWYPTARLFRQTVPGDWRSVIARVGEELARWRP
jgi:tetratricopeptide (TPR) repeat protein